MCVRCLLILDGVDLLADQDNLVPLFVGEQRCITFQGARGLMLLHLKDDCAFNFACRIVQGHSITFPGSGTRRYSMNLARLRIQRESAGKGRSDAVSAGGEADTATRWLDRHSVTNE